MIVKEEQNMTEPWIWAMLCACVGLCVWGMTRQMMSGINIEEKSISVIYVFGLSCIPCLVLVYFYKNKLYTCYDEHGIKIKYSPFTNEFIRWDEIKKIELVELNLFPYSIHYNEKYGMIYHGKNENQLRLETTIGNFIIGTSKGNEIELLLNKYNIKIGIDL